MLTVLLTLSYFLKHLNGQATSTINFFTSQAFTDTELFSWTVSYPQKKVSTCGQYLIAGGKSIFVGPGYISNLISVGSFYSLDIEGKILRLDSWNNEKIKILIDNTVVKEFILNNNDQYTVANLCGTTAKDEGIVAFKFTIPVINNRVSIKIQSESITGEWGLRDIVITAYRCHSACAFCEAESSSSCLLCGTQLYLYKKTCISSCGLSTLVKSKSLSINGLSILGDECLDCDASCTTCVGIASNQCLNCQSGKYFNAGSCLDSCPINSYQNEDLKSCIVCHSTCKGCVGVNYNECLKCSDPKRIFNQGECVTSCPQGNYNNKLLNECNLCQNTCGECDGPTYSDCTACRFPLYLYSRKCSPTCPNGYFGSNATSKCEKCHESCLTCKNNSPSDCLSCPLGKLLEQGKCVSQCSNGYFKDNTLLNCAVCNKTCSTCTGETDQDCTSCSGKLSLTKSQCTEKCPIGFYASNNLCSPCDKKCLECVGPSEKECLSCKNNSEYYVSNTKECLASCPEETFLNSALSRCELKKAFSATIEDNGNPYSFILSFSSIGNMNYYFQNDTNLIETIKYENKSLAPITFNTAIKTSSSVSMIHTYYVFLNYVEAPTSNLTVEIFLRNNASNGTSYILKSQSVLVNLRAVKACKSTEFFNLSSQLCENRLDLTFSLEYTDDYNKFVLRMSNPDDFTAFLLIGYSSAVIDSQNQPLNYTLERTEPTVMNLNLYLTNPIVGNPTFKFILELDRIPKTMISSNSKYNYPKPTASIVLKEYYLLSDMEIENIKLLKLRMNQGLLGVKAVMTVMMFLISAGGSAPTEISCFCLRGFLKIEVFEALQYLDIVAPPNVQEIYDAERLNYPNLIINVENSARSFFEKWIQKTFPEDSSSIPNRYMQNEISPYFYVNFGDVVAQFVLIYFITILLWVLDKYLKLEKRLGSIFLFAWLFLRRLFIWNWIIGCVIGNFLDCFFYIFLSFRYSEGNSPRRSADIFFSVVIFLIAIGVYIHFLVVIATVRTKSEEAATQKLSLEAILSSNYEKSLEEKQIRIRKLITPSDEKGEVPPKANESELEQYEDLFHVANGGKTPDQNTTFEIIKQQETPEEMSNTKFKQTHKYVPIHNHQLSEIYENKEELNFSERERDSRSVVRYNKANYSPQVIYIVGDNSDISIREDKTPQKSMEIDFKKALELEEPAINNEILDPRELIFQEPQIDPLQEGEQNQGVQSKEKSEPPQKAASIKPKNKILNKMYNPADLVEYFKYYSILFSDYKTDHFMQQFLLIIELFKLILVAGIVALINHSPYTQVILLSLVYISFLVIYINTRPFKSLLQFLFFVTYDAFILIAIAGYTNLTNYQRFDPWDTKGKMQTGWVIVACTFAVVYMFLIECFLNFLFFFIKFIGFLSTRYHDWKRSLLKKDEEDDITVVGFI